MSETPSTKLLLIDGSALLHRAYHAMPGLTNSSGQVVNAVYGFFSMLLTVLTEQKPTHLVICFDRTKPTVRQSMFAGYHAHRPKMESDLSDQFKLIDELLEVMKVHVASADGYEGDDVIGTYARQAVEEGIDQVIIVTGDRDLLQLVNDKTKILMTITGMTKTALFDATMVEEKYGVTPAQFIDYKALIGDQSDGYPGITGIGPKTAASLLQKFGTFENIFMKLDQLPEGTALKLATDAEQGALAKKLAAIILDAPVHLKLDSCRIADLDFVSVRKGFEAHQFKSLITRLDAKNPPPVEEVKIEVKKDKDEEQLGLL